MLITDIVWGSFIFIQLYYVFIHMHIGHRLPNFLDWYWYWHPGLRVQWKDFKDKYRHNLPICSGDKRQITILIKFLSKLCHSTSKPCIKIKWWQLLPAYARHQLFRPDLGDYEERFRARFALHILVTWHQVTLSVVVWVERVGLLVSLHDLGWNGSSLANAEPIHGPWEVIWAIMAGMLLFMATVGWRAAWSGHRHQVGVPVHLVGAFA